MSTPKMRSIVSVRFRNPPALHERTPPGDPGLMHPLERTCPRLSRMDPRRSCAEPWVASNRSFHADGVVDRLYCIQCA